MSTTPEQQDAINAFAKATAGGLEMELTTDVLLAVFHGVAQRMEADGPEETSDDGHSVTLNLSLSLEDLGKMADDFERRDDNALTKFTEMLRRVQMDMDIHRLEHLANQDES